MPTYEFRCPDGHIFEQFYRKISDGLSEVPCPVCGKLATRQMSAGAGLLFKGSGFYLTDYGKNAHRTSGGDSGAEKAKPAAEAGSGGEAKSAEGKPSETKPAESSSKNTSSGDTKSAGASSSTSSTNGKPEK